MDPVVTAFSRVVQSILQPSTEIRPRLASRFERRAPRTTDIAWRPAVEQTDAVVTDPALREPYAISLHRSVSAAQGASHPATVPQLAANAQLDNAQERIIPIDHPLIGREASVRIPDSPEPNRPPTVRTPHRLPTIRTSAREQRPTPAGSVTTSPSPADQWALRATETGRYLDATDAEQPLERAAPHRVAVATSAVTVGAPPLRPLESSDDVSSTRAASSTSHSGAPVPPRLHATPRNAPGTVRAAASSHEPFRCGDTSAAPALSPYRSRRDDAAPRHADTVQITIGRVEVRAIGTDAAPRKAAPSGPALRLDEYLRQRAEGRR
jgi:hypothetical protein